MRFFSGLTVFAFLVFSTAVAQTTNNLNAVRFVDANLVVAAGNAGTILRSNDGGSSWSALSSGSNANMYGISFANGSVGVAVGATQSFFSFYPELLSTANGGSSWGAQGYSRVIADVKFVDAQKAIAVGYTGTILRTLNGGSTWDPVSSGVTDNILSVDFMDANNGVASGSWGRVLRTNDGGNSWTSYASGTNGTLSGVDMVNANTIFAVTGAGLVFRSLNGGSSWTGIQTPVTANLTAVSFVDANNGWVVGWYGTILRTQNGGSSWTVQSSGTTNDLYGVSFRDVNTGVAVGLGGVILRTTNGGATWAPPSGGGGGGNPPAAPTLASPANGATGQSTILTFSWNSSSGANSYRLQVSTSSNFSSTVYDNSSINGTSQSVGGLANSTTYYWRTNASNNNGTSGWSDVWSFATSSGGSPPSAPALASPSNGATNQPTTLNLSWNSSGGATSYRLQVSTNSNFSSTVYDNSTSNTSQSVGGLANGTTYYWRANASNTFGTSGWSSVWSFSTSAMTGVPDFAVSPGSLDFGTIPTKTTKTLSVSVSNPGSATLVVSSISSSSGFFSVSPTSLSVPAGGSQNVNITFKPKNKNLVTATITFDHNAPNSPGTVSVSGRGGGTIRGAGTTTAGIPDEVVLDQNYPNPFNPTTEIEFSIPEDSRVKLNVYNMIGQEVSLLVDEVLPKGYYGASWTATSNDGRTLPSGIYIYRLQTTALSTGETVVRAGKMQFLK